MLKNFVAFQQAKKLYQLCKQLRLPEMLRDQLMRASASIALNLAEGSGKRTPQDQRRFYGIALGSVRECEAILELETVEHLEIRKLLDSLGAMTYALSAPEPKKKHRPLGSKPDSNSN
jgi:four helix bundle protein